MPKRIPIAAARRLAEQYGLSQVIIGAWDGERTHVVTYGINKEQCKQAATGGDMFKRAMGWDESLMSSRIDDPDFYGTVVETGNLKSDDSQ